jgi:tetratricopeptide (TPR) repeat protein
VSSSSDSALNFGVIDIEGLHHVCGTDRSKRRADIVFVHGLGGGARSTWAYGLEKKPGYFFWPAELGKEWPDCGIWTLGYEAGVIPWLGADGMPIEDRAINLAHKMTTRGLGDRPIIFIAHSMGGLMVKEIVVQSMTAGDRDWSALVSSIAGIVFCGTPHRGSDVASTARKLSIVLRTQEHIRDMAEGERHLERLHTRFVEWQASAKVPIEAYAERLGMTRQSVWLRWLPKVLIVPPGSADPQIAGCRCIPCNNHHTGLVKPSNREHDVYAGVQKFIKTCLASPLREQTRTPTSSYSSTSSPGNALHQLPPFPQGFVGREADLEILRSINPSEGTVLTGLRGMGGIGKTALALVLAHEWAARFPDGQLFLDGQGTREEPLPPSAGDLIAQVVQTFNPTAKLPDGEAALKSIYHQLLLDKKVLILLDNARDAAQAAPLIPPAGCALIVTSRQSFVLGTTKPHNVGKLPDEEAVALLREYHGSLGDIEAAELVRLCVGLPLALRIAGAHLALDAGERGGQPDVTGYLRVLGGGRLKNLDADANDAGEITVSETLRLSEAQLLPRERKAWRNLGVFTASFEAIAADAIAGFEEEMLGRFIRRSLLEREGTDRYKLHDLAADYACSQLSEGTLTELRIAHARHYAKVGATADYMYMKGNAVDGLVLFDSERAQIEAAFAWLTAQPDAAAARVLLELIDSVVYTADLRFHPRRRVAWMEAHLAAARIAENRRAEGAALGNLGNALVGLGDARKAIGYHEQALVISREIGDRRAEGQDLGNLGTAYAILGDARKAIEFQEQSLVISREISDRRAEGNALGNLGIVHVRLGYVDKAVGYLEEALVIAQEIGDRRGEGASLGNLGIAAIISGDARKALQFYEQQLAIVREIGDLRGEGNCLASSAYAYNSLGKRAEAFADAEAALRIFEAIEDPNSVSMCATLAHWREQ